MTYGLKVATDSACTSVSQSYTGLATTSKTLTSLADGTYYACVTATDAAGNTSAATNGGTGFLIDTTAPAAFAASGPGASSGAYLATATPTVAWAAATDANGVTYTLKIGTSSACSPAAQTYTALTTTSQVLSTLTDGTYYVCVTAVDAAGNTTASTGTWSFTTETVPPTATLPSPPTGTSSATTLNVTVAGTNVVKYQYAVGDGTLDCTGGANYSGWTAVGTPITASIASVADGTVDLCVVGQDQAGNAQAYTGATTATWTKDTTPPQALAAFTAATGTASAGDVALNWTYPATVTDYASLKVYRSAGATAPSCGGGSLVTTVSSGFTASGTGTYTDSQGSSAAGNYYSYTACAADAAGNVVSATQPNVQAMAAPASYIVFATIATYNGNLLASASGIGGPFTWAVAGADARCAYQEQGNFSAGLGDITPLNSGMWYAVLFDGVNQPKDRLHFDPAGTFMDAAGNAVASNLAAFWAGGNASQLSTYVNNGYAPGAAHDVTGYLWTGLTSTAAGDPANHCANFTSSSFSTYAQVGDAGIAGDMINASTTMGCGNSYHLLCVNQLPPYPLAGFTANSSGASQNAEVDLTITLPSDVSGYGRVDVWRLAGGTAPVNSCDGSDTSTKVFTQSSGFAANGTIAVSDTTSLTVGGAYSYRACVYNAGGALQHSLVVLGARTKGMVVFTTSTRTLGDLRGSYADALTGADAFCQARAVAASRAGTWKAVISTSSVSPNYASKHVTITGDVYNTNGDQVATATGTNAFFGSSHLASMAYDESGAAVAGSTWSNTNSGGSAVTTNNCSAYTSSGSSPHGTTGSPSATDGTWANSGNTVGCNFSLNLLCISQ